MAALTLTFPSRKGEGNRPEALYSQARLLTTNS